jgi:hypothetical protein
MAPELVETGNKPWGERLWKYFEGPWFWGGVALIAGAAAANVNLALVFVVGYVPISIGVFRSQFFRGSRKTLSNVAILVLGAIILFGVWKIIPKPQPPLTIGDIKSAWQSTAAPFGSTVPAASNEDGQVATKKDIQNLLRRFSQLQNESHLNPASLDAAKTPQPSVPTQIATPMRDQTKALKAITSTWTKSVNDWADSRLKEVPESPASLATAEGRKKAQDFHEEIMREWSGFAPTANTLLVQYYRLNLLQGTIHACSGINLGQGDRGYLETYKRCAGYIQAAADQLN